MKLSYTIDFKENFECMMEQEKIHKPKCEQRCARFEAPYKQLNRGEYRRSDGTLDGEKATNLLRGSCQ